MGTAKQVLATQFYMSKKKEKRVKKIAVVQSNYIPWKGYFDLINMVDEFILYDTMQYTRCDWRNRNKIKTKHGLYWLTIPVKVKGKFYQKIKDTAVSDPNWANNHWKTLSAHYARAPYFDICKELFVDLYLGRNSPWLSEINYRFLYAICKLLGIKTKLSWSSDYHIITSSPKLQTFPGDESEARFQYSADIKNETVKIFTKKPLLLSLRNIINNRTERLVDLCKQAGATEYISGPSAKNYIDPVQFEKAGILLSYIDYSNYPEYPQLYPPFEHGVSIVDLIFQTGPDAAKYMKGFIKG